MKIEKLNENKIQITFNNNYLQENNIDLHSFMSNSIETQSLFLNLLDQAEHEVGFITDNYKLSIETIALSNGNFLITITRIENENAKSIRVQPKRKNTISNSTTQIYKFENFDDLCNFENFITVSTKKTEKYHSISNYLYKYKNAFYLILQNIDKNYISEISSIISEFGISLQNSDLIIHKIKECGLLVREITT